MVRADVLIAIAIIIASLYGLVVAIRKQIAIMKTRKKEPRKSYRQCERECYEAVERANKLLEEIRNERPNMHRGD